LTGHRKWDLDVTDPKAPKEIKADYTFLCRVCGKSAGTVQVRAGEILIWSVGNLGAAIKAKDQKRVLAAVIAGDAGALYALDVDFAPFFCPSCRACYCDEHWEQEDSFEADGWFDCVWGTCPRGHKRILQD
jgi:hypothetical protein